MNLNFKFCLVLILITMGIMSACCQKSDTTYYSNKKIRSIEVKKDGEMVLKKFVSELGADLLTEQDFHYTYFDSLMGMTRIVDVKDNRVNREYWISNQDTIYNRAKFERDFDLKVSNFYKYVSKELAYPTDALEKGIQGKVIISFIVGKDGLVKQIKPISNLGHGLELSSIELLNKYKDWGILYLDSKPIEVYFRLPIKYQL